MKIDLAIAEIGSTTTLINAFNGIHSGTVHFVGQGCAPTSVEAGDVRIGLSTAFADLERKLGQSVDAEEMFATSSAAGGLRMCVHGLVYDMTVKAAHAAALGAGAIVKLATAGLLNEFDIEDVKNINPNLILLAGGTDYGERKTSVENAKLLVANGINSPVIYAGNVQNQGIIKRIFDEAGVPCYITDNVYPKLDMLTIEPARRIIHKVFEEHITQAAGMANVRDMVTGAIIPTPGAVMESAQLLYESIGDLVVIDIGGATTDIHSVTKGSDEISVLQTAPEPFAKRTVEGDLGLYVNANHVIDLIGADCLSRELNCDITEEMREYKPIPQTSIQFSIAHALCKCAGTTAFERHCGHLRYIYGPMGRQTIAEGKDLSCVKYLVATGGALTRLPEREIILRTIADLNAAGSLLAPRPGKIKLLYDKDYILASAGVMSKKYPEAALDLIKNSLNIR